MIAVACALPRKGAGHGNGAEPVADARRTVSVYGRVLDPPASARTNGEIWVAFEDARRFSLAVLALTRLGAWNFGVVVEAVPASGSPDSDPMPRALTLASQVTLAVARSRRSGIAVGEQDGSGRMTELDAAASLALGVARRWTPQRWEAVEHMLLGFTQTASAARLGISRQAVGQRLNAALWPEVEAVLTTLSPATNASGTGARGGGG